MYAIVKSGGRQIRVEKGETIQVDRLDAKVGDTIKLEQVLLLGGEQAEVAPDVLKKASVSGKVLGHLRGKKVLGLRYKPKKFYRRKVGNRANLTSVQITDIVATAEAAPVAEPPQSTPDASSSEGSQVKEG